MISEVMHSAVRVLHSSAFIYNANNIIYPIMLLHVRDTLYPRGDTLISCMIYKQPSFPITEQCQIVNEFILGQIPMLILSVYK
jgi:hypothetical protein